MSKSPYNRFRQTTVVTDDGEERYGEWRPYRLTVDSDIREYVVRRRDLMRPDIISLEAYGTEELWWYIMDHNGIFDPFSMEIGQRLEIPPKPQLKTGLNRADLQEREESEVIRVKTMEPYTPPSFLRFALAPVPEEVDDLDLPPETAFSFGFPIPALGGPGEPGGDPDPDPDPDAPLVARYELGLLLKRHCIESIRINGALRTGFEKDFKDIPSLSAHLNAVFNETGSSLVSTPIDTQSLLLDANPDPFEYGDVVGCDGDVFTNPIVDASNPNPATIGAVRDCGGDLIDTPVVAKYVGQNDFSFPARAIGDFNGEEIMGYAGLDEIEDKFDSVNHPIYLTQELLNKQGPGGGIYDALKPEDLVNSIPEEREDLFHLPPGRYHIEVGANVFGWSITALPYGVETTYAKWKMMIANARGEIIASTPILHWGRLEVSTDLTVTEPDQLFTIIRVYERPQVGGVIDLPGVGDFDVYSDKLEMTITDLGKKEVIFADYCLKEIETDNETYAVCVKAPSVPTLRDRLNAYFKVRRLAIGVSSSGSRLSFNMPDDEDLLRVEDCAGNLVPITAVLEDGTRVPIETIPEDPEDPEDPPEDIGLTNFRLEVSADADFSAIILTADTRADTDNWNYFDHLLGEHTPFPVDGVDASVYFGQSTYYEYPVGLLEVGSTYYFRYRAFIDDTETTWFSPPAVVI